MGRLFLEHLGGIEVYSCLQCHAPLTNRSQIINRNFLGTTGTAYLFGKVVNVDFSEIMTRDFTTGRHKVRDVFCKNCSIKLGWYYEFAYLQEQSLMGRVFLDHVGGARLFSCASCDTILTNRSELISTRFTGATGRAFLFNKVVNLSYSDVQDRVMLTGRHMVRDVNCKNCDAKLGWVYEFATEENQRYKEGRVILERALVTETDGIEERMGED